MAITAKLPGSLPNEAGYTQLLGVPMEVIEQLRALRLSALEGELSLESWSSRHATILDGVDPLIDPAGRKRLAALVGAAADGTTDDFDRFMFLGGLAANLRLLQTPDPDRELRELEEALPTLSADLGRAKAERRLAAVRAMTAQDPSAPYEPASRMLKALRVGTLEETYRWLKDAIAQDPGASVQDLVTRAAVEVANAKMDLDRYDGLNDSPA
jgi:hypothetical protein